MIITFYNSNNRSEGFMARNVNVEKIIMRRISVASGSFLMSNITISECY